MSYNSKKSRILQGLLMKPSQKLPKSECKPSHDHSVLYFIIIIELFQYIYLPYCNIKLQFSLTLDVPLCV